MIACKIHTIGRWVCCTLVHLDGLSELSLEDQINMHTSYSHTVVVFQQQQRWQDGASACTEGMTLIYGLSKSYSYQTNIQMSGHVCRVFRNLSERTVKHVITSNLQFSHHLPPFDSTLLTRMFTTQSNRGEPQCGFYQNTSPIKY